MSQDKKPFRELVTEAPVASKPQPISLVGALSRSSSEDQFALSFGDRRTVTLPVEAVEDYAILGSSMGQMIVRIDIDVDQVPETLRAIFSPPPVPWHQVYTPPPDPWRYTAYAVYPPGGLPVHTGSLDPHPYPPKVQFDPQHPLSATPAYRPEWGFKTPYQDHTGVILDPPHPWKVQYDPPLQPFVAATPHQASLQTIAALQGVPYLAYAHNATGIINDKPPGQDGTTPPHGHDY